MRDLYVLTTFGQSLPSKQGGPLALGTCSGHVGKCKFHVFPSQNGFIIDDAGRRTTLKSFSAWKLEQFHFPNLAGHVLEALALMVKNRYTTQKKETHNHLVYSIVQLFTVSVWNSCTHQGKFQPSVQKPAVFQVEAHLYRSFSQLRNDFVGILLPKSSAAKTESV